MSKTKEIKKHLNLNSKEFRSKSDSFAPKLAYNYGSVCASKLPYPVEKVLRNYFRGVLPEGYPIFPISMALPPNMEVWIEEGKLIISDGLPSNLKEMLMEALRRGKFHEGIKESLKKSNELASQQLGKTNNFSILEWR